MADEAVVRRVLGPYQDRLRRIVDLAYADWLQSSDKPKYIYERTRANARFDHVARHAHAEFGSDTTVRIIDGYETIKLVIRNGRDVVIVRFKHANEDGLGVNGQQTQTVLGFIDAEQPLLPNVPVEHKVEICFRENELDTALESVEVVARHMFKKMWSYPLPKATATVVPFKPTTPPDQGPPEVRPRQIDRDTKKEPDQGQ
jgi:hypothetical protein